MATLAPSRLSNPGAPRMPKPSKELILAAQAVFAAMAYVKTVSPVVEAYQRQILAENEFFVAQEWVDYGAEPGRILDPKQRYDMDNAQFKIFDELVYAKAVVYDPCLQKGQCVLGVAEHEQVKAEWALLAESKSFLNSMPGVEFDPMKVGGANRKKLLDMLLGLLSKFVDKK